MNRQDMDDQGQEAALDEGQATEQDRSQAEYRDKYLRLLAEQENRRKQLERAFEDRLREAKRRLLLKLLSLADDLERALSYAKTDDPLAKGVKMIHQQMQNLLAEEGVESIVAEGQPFDPSLHEAVELVLGQGEGDVVEKDLLKGYTYQGQLLRPAQVRVRRGS